jgi:5-methylthioadenosine/S-adenosylhomocysteine deaminase
LSKILISGGWVLTMDRGLGEFPKGDVLVENDRIVKVARRIRSPDAKVIDAAGMIVMPGLVNAHMHAWQTGLRGIAADWTIPEYMRRMHAGIAPSFTANDTYLGGLVGALNQIDGGVTTLFDWCHNNKTPAHSDAAIDGLMESGIRAVFGHGSPKPDAGEGDRPYPEIPHPDSEIRRLRTGRLSADDGLVTLAMAILGPDFSTWEVCEHDYRLAREYDVLSSAHVWGSPQRLNPDGYQRLAKAGLLGPDHNLVHGNYLGDDEIKLVLDHGVSITVTPEVEIQMSHAAPLTGRVRALGARPSLGVDIESNISGDMFQVIRFALQYQRILDNQSAAAAGHPNDAALSIDSQEALEWATIDGARALRLDDRIGSLTPGKQADLIMINATDTNLFPVHDATRSVVLQASAGNVDTVMVAGKWVKRNGKLRYRGLADKKRLLERSARRILKKAGRARAAA